MKSNTRLLLEWDCFESQIQKCNRQRSICLVDIFFKNNIGVSEILQSSFDHVFYIDRGEPATAKVNEFCRIITGLEDINCVVGIGGGSILDLAKATAVTANNGGRSENLQGWDLPCNKGLDCVVFPTIPGTGAEVSRTAVLKGPERKLGINSDFVMPTSCIIDPSLFSTVPLEFGIPTLLDCYIHCVEVVQGKQSDRYAVMLSEEIIERFQDLFQHRYAPEQRELAEVYAYCSYLGGLSLLGGVVGACHALSYGLSNALDINHSVANLISMEVLVDYYGDHCAKVSAFCEKNQFDYKSLVVSKNQYRPTTLGQISEGSLFMQKLWTNAALPGDDYPKNAHTAIQSVNRLLRELL